MLFVASKLFWASLAPANLLVVALALALVLRRRAPRASRALLALATSVCLLVLLLPVGEWIAHPLEERFPRLAALPERVDGIVVLGGGIDPLVSESRGQPTLTESAERMTSVLHLARRYPAARIVLAGGSGSVVRQRVKEAPWALAFLEQMGIDVGRVALDSASRNTFENAVFARRVAAPRAVERWLLVTSAMHMPRAVGCFRRIGWEVTPYPVDFQTTRGFALWSGFDFSGGLVLLDAAAREWVGLVAYYVLGRTTEILPGPRAARAARPRLDHAATRVASRYSR
ncbi:MAG: YdcF family protein [Deltaproteobacteria bacterium]|nr:YdcF family protein [Deltaproteobacteria bacterium]